MDAARADILGNGNISLSPIEILSQVCSFIYSYIYSLIPSFIHSFIHRLVNEMTLIIWYVPHMLFNNMLAVCMLSVKSEAIPDGHILTLQTVIITQLKL